MSLVELKMPMIPDEGRIAYGGDQEWCRTAWRRGCGCGPTTGANLCAYYAMHRPHLRALYPGSLDPFVKEEYIDVIEDVFRFITPSYMGFPFAGLYAHKYRTYALYRAGVQLACTGCGKAETAQQMYDFVRRGVDSGNPLALLLLRHRAPELKEDNWHWVTVSGYLDGADGQQVVLSNCGLREVRPASMLFERHRANTVRLICFEEKR